MDKGNNSNDISVIALAGTRDESRQALCTVSFYP
jgi:hypothetical protein